MKSRGGMTMKPPERRERGICSGARKLHQRVVHEHRESRLQILKESQNQIRKKLATQAPKTGKSDYFFTPNRPGPS
jgi:hypothetical protein